MLHNYVVFCTALIACAPLRAGTSTIVTEIQTPSISEVNLATFTQGPTAIPIANDPGAMALSRDGKTFYMTIYASQGIQVIDRATRQVTQTFQTQYQILSTYPPSITPDGSKLFVGTCSLTLDESTCQGGEVEVIDTATGASLGVVSMGGDQVAEVLATAGTVYVLHFYNPTTCCDVARQNLTGAPPPQNNPPPSNSLTAINVLTLQIGVSFMTPGGGGGQIVVSLDGQTGYIAAGALYKVDLPQLTITDTLLVPGEGGMGLSSDGRILALASGSSQILFVDTSTLSVTSIVGGVQGGIVGVGADGNMVVTETGGFAMQLFAVDAQTATVTPELQGCAVFFPFVTADGGSMFVISDGLEALPQGSTTPSAYLDALRSVSWLAVSRDGKNLYASGSESGITAISLVDGKATNFTTAVSLAEVVVSREGGKLYAVDNFNGVYQVQTINASSGVSENTITLPCDTDENTVAYALALSPGGRYLYAMACGDVVEIDTQVQKIVRGITHSAGGIVGLNPSGDALYASTGDDGVFKDIKVFDTTTFDVLATLPNNASAAAFSPDGTRVYLAENVNGMPGIAVIDTATYTQLQYVTGVEADGSESLAITTDGSLLYVTGQQGGIIDTATLQVTSGFNVDGPIIIY